MSFLRNYLTFAAGNEAPEIFHVWSGISAMSSFVSRRVHIKMGYFDIYPNMYILLVGGPGITKTTAMSIAKNMVREVKDIPLAATAITKEALTRYMAEQNSPCRKFFKPSGTNEAVEYNHMSIFATEFSHFLGNNALGMIDFLTTVYDETQYEVKTKNKGDDLIIGPYITMLGCMTPETTNNFLKQQIITGGFARRTIFVIAFRRGKPVAFPVITEEQREAWRKCVEWGKTLQKVGGEFRWEPEAKQWYINWYEGLRADKKSFSDPTTVGYYQSKHVQLLKTAMLVALSEGLDLIMTLPHLEVALAFLDKIEEDLPKVFEGTGRNEEAGIAAKIRAALETSDRPLTMKQLLATFYSYGNRRELLAIVDHLVDIGHLKRVAIQSDKGINVQMVGTPAQIDELIRKMGVKPQKQSEMPAASQPLAEESDLEP